MIFSINRMRFFTIKILLIMTKKLLAILLIFALTLGNTIQAHNDDEGMWLPFLVQKLNMKKMQKMGLKLSADEIYSINTGSLKDAIIALDHGSCTGELVSNDGLFLTNHHCGYGEIQAHSSVEHDYLTDGFWAYSREQELVNPDKTVSFLISIEDVTDKINAKLTAAMTEDERENMIRKVSKDLEDLAVKNSKSWYEAEVQSFFKGNNFYLFVYETFKDVRLVGAPPSSIGKYGADTDNWMWPRHTGDFSMFRIYSAPDGSPAAYAKENVPYHPKHFLPISLKGVKKNDFAMIMGYPGSTTRYMTSWGVQQTIDNENTIRIKLRGMKQDIMKADMDAAANVRIMYASKYSQSTNYYKYSIGQNLGLKNLNVVAKKQAEEKLIGDWINKNKSRKEKYGEALGLIQNAIAEGDKYDKVRNYWFEAFYLGPDFVRFALTVSRNLDNAEVLEKEAADYFKDLNLSTDKKIFIAMAKVYKEDIDAEFLPAFYETINQNFNGSIEQYADSLYSKSIFTDKTRFAEFIKNASQETLQNDLGMQFTMSVIQTYQGIYAQTAEIESRLNKGERLYMAARLEMEKKKSHYPDANSTMRLTYGTIGDYKAGDKQMPLQTYLDEYMAKEDPNNEEFVVSPKLKELYQKADYGQYAEKQTDGSVKMPICYITNNDITGGNSGSPSINAEGQLIGIAFDGNWEAMSGDIAYEPNLQRTIIADIRFVLFVIDKYAGAENLIKELTLVK